MLDKQKILEAFPAHDFERTAVHARLSASDNGTYEILEFKTPRGPRVQKSCMIANVPKMVELGYHIVAEPPFANSVLGQPVIKYKEALAIIQNSIRITRWDLVPMVFHYIKNRAQRFETN